MTLGNFLVPWLISITLSNICCTHTFLWHHMEFGVPGILSGIFLFLSVWMLPLSFLSASFNLRLIEPARSRRVWLSLRCLGVTVGVKGASFRGHNSVCMATDIEPRGLRLSQECWLLLSGLGNNLSVIYSNSPHWHGKNAAKALFFLFSFHCNFFKAIYTPGRAYSDFSEFIIFNLGDASEYI